ncbi:MAG: RIP metalloprotease RseP [Alphaproteobacteria bacterium]|nr:RIP metalloprotease RseP [Alphaproteobacteria bacterium]
MGPLFWGLVGLSAIVVVHEFGHYWLARRAGVRVEVFSVGFGPELFGYSDQAGTRWRFSLIPLGGYVKMFGQSDLGPDSDGTQMTEAERAVSFNHKKLSQKTAIVAAGPLANIIFSIAIFTILFSTVGQQFTPAKVSEVVAGSAADAAGLEPGDEFLKVAGRSIARFEEVRDIIISYPGIPVDIVVNRAGREIDLVAKPKPLIVPDGLGGETRIGLLGVKAKERAFERHSLPVAAWQGVREIISFISLTATGIRQMFAQQRSPTEMVGPLGIAQILDKAADYGIVTVMMILAKLSISIGLVNLLPIPILDGGHLAFYAYESVVRRPPAQWVKELLFKIGLVFVLGLMLFVIFNDFTRFPMVQRFFALFV